MCGRYTGYVDENAELRTIYDAAAETYPGVKLSSGEIFPTNTVPLIGSDAKIFPAVWGYPGYSGKGVIINARAENAAGKTMFRDSLANRRCAVPTTGFFEWSADKTKYRFNLDGDAMLFLAGFYKRFDDGFRYVILTTAANPSMVEIHDRMPVILPRNAVEPWLTDRAFASEYLTCEMPELIRRAAGESRIG